MDDLSPRQRRHLRTKDAILTAARQIITETGFEGLSMREIAQRIDYSPAGLYEYFGSKDDIVTAVCLQAMEQFTTYLSRVDTSLPVDDYLIELGLAYIDFAKQNKDQFLLMFTTGLPPQEVQELIDGDSSFTILLNGIQRGLAEKVFKLPAAGTDLDMAYAAWSIVHGAAMLHLMHLDKITMEQDTVNRTALQFLVKGFMA